MKFPTWNDFKSSMKEFKKDFADIRKKHVFIDGTIQSAFMFLPFPFNSIANILYSELKGTQENKANEVERILDDLEKKGEAHYNQTMLKLETITGDIHDIRGLVAKESTLLSIKEVILSSSKVQQENLEQIRKDVEEIKFQLRERLPTLDAIGNMLRITDEVTPSVKAILMKTPMPKEAPDYRTVSEYQGEVVKVVSREGVQMQTITAYDLLRLDKKDQDHIQVYKEKMDYLYRLWKKIYVKVDKSTDELHIAKTEEQLADLAKQMCQELRNILDFLEQQLHLHLHDHYREIRDICVKHGEVIPS